MQKYLYHITANKNLPSILKNGLKPAIGEHSKLVHETEPAIFLCNRRDIPYWKIILGISTVLQIDETAVTDKELYKYSLYTETLCHNAIPPNAIKHVYGPKPTKKHMRDLCESYMWSLSSLTTRIARYYMYYQDDQDYHDDIETSIDATLAVVNNLDYSVYTKDEIKKILKNIGDCGEYSFVDEYLNTGHRMYVQLLYYPKDDLTGKRTKLYDYIHTTFYGCLRVNTGGWTG